MMPIPTITHLQFLVLVELRDGPRSGRELRAWLADQGARKSLPAFYQLMSRLEEAGLVRGWYESTAIDGQAIRERWYEITESGRAEWDRVRAFYRAVLARHFAANFEIL